jgi:coproporphyrinogen III oxidase
MVKKKEISQGRNSHDECVRELAQELKADKWNVKANVEGAEKPAKVGGFTPDIEATKKGCLHRICEVLTEKDFKGNKEAYIEFKNYCDEYDFHFYIVDKDGKRRQIDPKTLGKKHA